MSAPPSEMPLAPPSPRQALGPQIRPHQCPRLPRRRSQQAAPRPTSCSPAARRPLCSTLSHGPRAQALTASCTATLCRLSSCSLSPSRLRCSIAGSNTAEPRCSCLPPGASQERSALSAAAFVTAQPAQRLEASIQVELLARRSKALHQPCKIGATISVRRSSTRLQIARV